MSGRAHVAVTSGDGTGTPTAAGDGGRWGEGAVLAGRAARWPLVAAGVLGAVGVSLELAGIRSPVRAVCILVFLAVAPTAAVEGLLPETDRFGHLLVSCTATVVIVAAVAIVLLATGEWSPVAGVFATGGVVALCVVGQSRPVRNLMGRKTVAHGEPDVDA